MNNLDSLSYVGSTHLSDLNHSFRILKNFLDPNSNSKTLAFSQGVWGGDVVSSNTF